MAVKATALAPKVVEWPVGLTRAHSTAALQISDDPDTSCFRDAISLIAGDQALEQLPRDTPPAENYQIALIPMPRFMERLQADAPVFTELNSVVVLPLTWNDLVTRLREEGGAKSRRNSETIIFGPVCVKLAAMEVTRNGKPVPLTALEFKLLRYLVLHPGRVIPRDELLNEVWGFENYPCTRTVDTHVWRLRQKLETDPSNPEHFHTVHAIGYKFVP